MADRPYTLLSCSVSLDGYLDSPATHRLALSNEADFERVDGVRASCDAIMVGAATIRNDDPRLLVRSSAHRRERVDRGLPASPLKVTVTGSACLDPTGQFFTAGEGEKLVYCVSDRASSARRRLGRVAEVVDLGDAVGMREISEDLNARGINRLMVEGGATLHTQFLTGGLADELQLVVAPLFVGDSRARRFVLDGFFPWNEHRRADLAEVRQIGDVVLMRYALTPRFYADQVGS